MKSNIVISLYFLELKLRLLYIFVSFIMTFIICCNFSLEFVYIYIRPFFFYKHFIFTDLTEALHTYIKIHLISSFLFIFPYIFYQFWSFFAPSIKKNTRNIQLRKYFYIFFMIIWSLSITYFLILPEIYKFLVSFEIKTDLLTIQLEARIKPYAEFTFNLFVIITFIFQIPLILQIIYKTLNFNLFFFPKYRKYYLFASLIFSSLFTSPEIFSQLLFTFFLYFNIEFSFFFNLLEFNLKKIFTGSPLPPKG